MLSKRRSNMILYMLLYIISCNLFLSTIPSVAAFGSARTSSTTLCASASHPARYCCTTLLVKNGTVMILRIFLQWSPYTVNTMSWPFPVNISKTTLRVRDPNSTPCVCNTSRARGGEETTTRLRWPIRRRKASPYLRASSVRLRWFRSSPTWSQLPKIGTGIGPGGRRRRLPRSLEMTMARIMAAKRPSSVFSSRSRSILGWTKNKMSVESWLEWVEVATYKGNGGDLVELVWFGCGLIKLIDWNWRMKCGLIHHWFVVRWEEYEKGDIMMTWWGGSRKQPRCLEVGRWIRNGFGRGRVDVGDCAAFVL